MLTDDQLRHLLLHGEPDHVERTVSTSDADKFGEAICSFANDLPDRRQPGVLFIGVRDDGDCGYVQITEQVLQRLLSFRTDGNILPPPIISVRRHTLDGCTMAVVEVQPSTSPPLKYKGRVCIRVGPRRGFATAEEERSLIEKRVWGNLPFDQQSIKGATIDDLDKLRFQEELLPASVHPDVIAANKRSLEQQMQALGVLNKNNEPTVMGILVCGKDPQAWLPGAYVQFVRYPGTEIGDAIVDQKQISAAMPDLFRRLDEVIAANITQSADLSGTKQSDSSSYPTIAVQELIRNALIHRNYEGTASPVMVNWYSDRIEITSPGGPYGVVTAATFGRPGLTDARNPALATAAKALGFVQRFGSGIPRAKAALSANGNPGLEFQVEPNFVNVKIWSAR
jgi:ATP-dependent DNA helicase RecG